MIILGVVKLNKIQNAAFELIQADARFIYTLTDMYTNTKNIKTNYMLMSLPYIGVFADGSEQWARKMKMEAPMFSEIEKKFYIQLRQGHKLFDKSYSDLVITLKNELEKSDKYFYSIRSIRERMFGYYNIGTDICYNKYCGNTILCACYLPIEYFYNPSVGVWIRDMSVVAGKLASWFGCAKFPPYKYEDIILESQDYHFYKKSPLSIKNDFGLLLFSVVCSINFIIEFIENYFQEEIPQKLKFAYLLYYYLCDFIHELNMINHTNFMIDTTLKNRKFRNCLAHYGLGQFLSENEIIEDDLFKGLTNKVFNMDYLSTKKELYKILHNLVTQIEKYVLL